MRQERRNPTQKQHEFFLSQAVITVLFITCIDMCGVAFSAKKKSIVCVLTHK